MQPLFFKDHYHPAATKFIENLGSLQKAKKEDKKWHY